MKKNKMNETKNRKIKLAISEVVSENDEVKKLIQIVVLLLIIFFVFYGITVLLTKKGDNNLKLEENETEIQFKEILVSKILEQKEVEYYVLIGFEKDLYNQLYENYFNYYQSKGNVITYYTININNGFNEKYIGDNSNLNVTNVNELRFKEATLLKIKNKKIVSSFEGREEIINHLDKLVK